MKKILTIFCLLFFVGQLAAGMNSLDRTEKDIDKRSISPFPKIRIENDLICMYSNLQFENLHVQITNEKGEVLLDSIVDISIGENLVLLDARGSTFYVINLSHCLMGNVTYILTL